MRPYDSSQPLISIHVPRTGGTSVRACLEQWFAPTGFYTHYADEANHGKPFHHTLTAQTCVHGHFNKFRGFGVQDYYPKANQWITFLRNPFERHVSLFFYLRKHEGKYFFAGRPVPTIAWLSFEDFLNFLADNRDALQQSFANTMLAHLPLEPEKYPPAALLEQFIHVGITEKLDQSLWILASKLGRNPLTVPRLNSAERNQSLDQHLRQRHKQLFPVEHAIYRAAVALHEREFGQFNAHQQPTIA